MIAQSSTFSEDQLAAGALQLTTRLKHKYAEDVPVSIRVEMAGVCGDAARRVGQTAWGGTWARVVVADCQHTPA
jgi:hypothetical protein